MEIIHATCIAAGGHGVLIRGPSGSGKSDLALRLIFAGAKLVADDRTVLEVEDGRLKASAPQALAGLLEVRGLGVVAVGSESEATVRLAVDLASPDKVERMPEEFESTCDLLGVPVRRLVLAPFESSAAAKVLLAVRVAAGEIGMAL